MPYDESTQKKYGENPLQKRSGFKMKGMDFGNSPLADKGEVVKTKSADGTKTKYKKGNRPKVKNYETSTASSKTKKGRIVHY